jgi:hypothetical protein
MSSVFETLCDRIANNDPDFDTDQDLSGQDINPQNALILARAINSNSTLRSLEITGNAIGFEGAKALINALKNTSLTAFYCNYNEIGGATDAEQAGRDYDAFFKPLEGSELRTFDISFTGIGQNGIVSIIKILESTQITTLYINGNGVTDDQKLIIRNILSINREKYASQFWSPWRHISFVNEDDSSHEMVLTSLLCGSVFSTRLPFHIWFYIFSFWQRKNFRIESDDDDMSDGDINEEMDVDEEADDEESDDDEADDEESDDDEVDDDE